MLGFKSILQKPARILALSLVCVSAAPAWASYYGVLDTGEVLPAETYKITADTQILTEEGGLNLGARIDAGFQEEYGARAILGFGSTDIYVGGMFKWVPIPDMEGQPAMGFNTGLIYGKDRSERELTLRWEPLASKKFDVEGTVFTPYASLPVGYRMRNSDNPRRDDNEITLQLVVGSQLELEQWKRLQFIAELGVDLNNAPSHVSAGAILYFDEEGGVVIE